VNEKRVELCFQGLMIIILNINYESQVQCEEDVQGLQGGQVQSKNLYPL